MCCLFLCGKKSVTLGIHLFLPLLIKINVKVALTCHERHRKGVEHQFSFLTQTLYGGQFVKFTPRPLYRRDRNPLAIVDEVVWDTLMVFMNMRRKHLLPLLGFKPRIVQPVVRCRPGTCPSLWYSVKTSTQILNSVTLCRISTPCTLQ